MERERMVRADRTRKARIKAKRLAEREERWGEGNIGGGASTAVVEVALPLSNHSNSHTSTSASPYNSTSTSTSATASGSASTGANHAIVAKDSVKTSSAPIDADEALVQRLEQRRCHAIGPMIRPRAPANASFILM
jgi:hypothetical protein